jgi:predicted transcriptional regulator
MARRKTRTLTELELQIMQIVWKNEEIAVEDIRQTLEQAGKPLALPSIRTMLGILQEKGYVTRRAEGRRFVYRARVPQEKARESILKDVVDRAFDGSALDLVAALFDTRLVSKRDMDAVKRLIREAEGGTKT